MPLSAHGGYVCVSPFYFALIQATALLARWWHWQPSEIDALPVQEFEAYIKEANEQIKREYPDN